ncbi:hypothetical protein LXL04_000508 [Taraxacum kok-saghyz]
MEGVEETVDLDPEVEHPEHDENELDTNNDRAPCWLEFTKFTDKFGDLRSKCKHCSRGQYKCEKKYGTTNLNLHLTKCKAYLAKISGGQTQLAHGDQNRLTSWRFEQKENRKALAYMIVVDELPFRFVEGAGFKHYNSVSQPLFKIPCRSTTTLDVYALFEEEKEKIGAFIKKNKGRICLTTDTWTSTQQSCYMCLTAHFVNNEWKLVKKVLNFCPQEYHRGVDIGKVVETCLIEWGIENILTISVDNASANDVAIEFLKKNFQNSNKCLLNGKWTHIRCVAHVLNLVVQDGVKKVGSAVENVRWACRWIRQAPSRIDKFAKFSKLVTNGTTKHLTRDVSTRWNSTYQMLEVAQAYEKTFERYDFEESEFRTEIEKAGLSVPSASDWKRIRELCHFLKPFFEVTKRVSGTLYVTSNSVVEDIFAIRTLLDEAIFDANLVDIALAMKTKFDKYFGDVEKMNLLLYFALILDPRNKVKYLGILLEDRYGPLVADMKKKLIMDSMYELFNDYTRIHSPSTASTTSSSILGKRQNPDALPLELPLRNKLREKMRTNMVESFGDLERYLNESVEDDSPMFSILDWWKVNSPRFPILSLMARDLLAIPVSTVASESVFSTSGRILDPYRSSLTDKMIQCLICTQDWLRGGIIDELGCEEDWDALQELEKELGQATMAK